jgi:hypothetical protein
LLIALSSIAAVSVCGIAVILGGYLDPSQYLVQLVLQRFLGVVLWLSLVPLEVLVTIAVWHSEALRRGVVQRWRDGLRLAAVVLLGSAVQWSILIFHPAWLYEVPGWFWHYSGLRAFRLSQVILVVSGVIAVFTIRTLVKSPGRRWRNLATCVVLGFVLQLGFGLADGRGLEAIRLRYVNSGLSEEAQLACESPGTILSGIANYEEEHGRSRWLGTKPPGLFGFYLLMRDLMGIMNPGAAVSSGTCFEVLTRVASFVFPLAVALIVLPMYGIEKLVGDSGFPNVSGMMFVAMPNVLLMSLFPDDFLYPLLFVTCVLAVGWAIHRRSFARGLVAGMGIYIAIFVSFSLLPLLGLTLGWIALDAVLTREAHARWDLLRPALGVLMGAGVMWSGTAMLFGYSPLIRYSAAFALHRTLKGFQWGSAFLLEYMFLNNLEFLMWSGVAIVILSACGILTLARGASSRPPVLMRTLAGTYGLTLIGVNLLGQTRGEVGRIWIYLLPVGAIIAVRQAVRLFRSPVRAFQFFFMIEYITACVVFFRTG